MLTHVKFRFVVLGLLVSGRDFKNYDASLLILALFVGQPMMSFAGTRNSRLPALLSDWRQCLDLQAKNL